jgi:hypothetical protein
MISSHTISTRKLLRVIALALIGLVATGLAISNLIAFDEQSRYFAAAEFALALVVFGALVHEIRIGGWRSAGR